MNPLQTLRNALWQDNPALTQLLGLCPLLAVTTTLVAGLGLGIATLFVLVASNCIVSLLRKQLHVETRLLVFVLIIAALVSAIDLGMHAYLYDMHEHLGIYVPLIATNCIILAHAETFASKNRFGASFVDGLGAGLGFAIVLVVFGGLRELIGQGTLLAGAPMLFGEASTTLVIDLSEVYRGFRFALVPPGAFIALGLIVALKSALQMRAERTATASSLSVTQQA